jgi:hypothetical protein
MKRAHFVLCSMCVFAFNLVVYIDSIEIILMFLVEILFWIQCLDFYVWRIDF